MLRHRREAQPLGAARHGRVVDRLNVNLVAVERQVAGLLAARCVAYEKRHGVRHRGHQRQAGLAQAMLAPFRSIAVPDAQFEIAGATVRWKRIQCTLAKGASLPGSEISTDACIVSCEIDMMPATGIAAALQPSPSKRTFWPGRSICTPAVTTRSPFSRPFETTIPFES